MCATEWLCCFLGSVVLRGLWAVEKKQSLPMLFASAGIAFYGE